MNNETEKDALDKTHSMFNEHQEKQKIMTHPKSALRLGYSISLSDYLDKKHEENISSMFNITEDKQPTQVTREALNEAYIHLSELKIRPEKRSLIIVDMSNDAVHLHNKKVETENEKIFIIGFYQYLELSKENRGLSCNYTVNTLNGMPIHQVWFEEATNIDFNDFNDLKRANTTKEYQGELKSNRSSKRLKKHKKWNHQQSNKQFTANGKVKRR